MLEFLETPLTVLHIFVSLFMVLVILIQPGKSGGLGAALGGAGAQQVFGGRGAGNFLSRMTWISAGIFFLTSVLLAYVSSSTEDSLADRRTPKDVEQLDSPVKPEAKAVTSAPSEAQGAAPEQGAESAGNEQGAGAEQVAESEQGADGESAAAPVEDGKEPAPKPEAKTETSDKAKAPSAASPVAPKAPKAAAPRAPTAPAVPAAAEPKTPEAPKATPKPAEPTQPAAPPPAAP